METMMSKARTRNKATAPTYMTYCETSALADKNIRQLFDLVVALHEKTMNKDIWSSRARVAKQTVTFLSMIGINILYHCPQQITKVTP